jgi:hypothetical protein
MTAEFSRRSTEVGDVHVTALSGELDMKPQRAFQSGLSELPPPLWWLT